MGKTLMLLLLLQATFFIVFSEEHETIPPTSPHPSPPTKSPSPVTVHPPAHPPHHHNNNNIILITHNTSIVSQNRAFKLGFFNIEERYYLCISFTFRPSPNIIWIANRNKPITNLSTSSLRFTETSKLQLVLTPHNTILWESNTPPQNTPLNPPKLLNNGNLILTTSNGVFVWQSYEEPVDTLLPGMKVTQSTSLVSWRTISNPSPGSFSLRLRPPLFDQFELLYNDSVSYWSSGNLTITLNSASILHVEVSGQVSQYTWSNHAWKKVWSMPRWVLGGDCGSFAIATDNILNPCHCLTGYEPTDGAAWGPGDYSKGCFRRETCRGVDVFEDQGGVKFRGGSNMSYQGQTKGSCEKKCLSVCECVGFFFKNKNGFCRVFYGTLYDFEKIHSSNVLRIDGFYLRISRKGSVKKLFSSKALIAILVVSLITFTVVRVVVILRTEEWRRGLFLFNFLFRDMNL